MKKIVRLTENDLTRIISRLIKEQNDLGFTMEELPPNVQEFIKKTGLKAESFIKPVPPNTGINYKKRDGTYIGLGDMNYVKNFVDTYMKSSGVVGVVNKMIQNK